MSDIGGLTKKLEEDVNRADVWANGPAGASYTAKDGVKVLSIRTLSEKAEINIQASEASAKKAEAAATAAQIGAGIFESVMDGLSHTNNGDFFNVSSKDNSYFVIQYYNNNGKEVEVKKYPSASYIDDISSLTKNATVIYPFSQTVRNGVNSDAGVLILWMTRFILDIKVIGADSRYFYRIQQISNSENTTTKNRWIFERVARANYKHQETRGKTYTCVFDIVPNSGIRSFHYNDPDGTGFYLTVDTGHAVTSNNWLSVSKDHLGYSYIIDPSKYSYVSNHTNQVHGLRSLKRDLYNPLRDVNIRFIGDSITWGVGASGSNSNDGNTGNIDTSRNNLVAPCYVNLLRNWLGITFMDSEYTKDAEGSAYFEKEVFISPHLNDSHLFKFFSTFINEEVPLTTVGGGGSSDYYFDIRPSAIANVSKVCFETNSKQIVINHALLEIGSDDEKIKVYVDNNLHSSFNVKGPSSFGHSHVIKLDGKNHSIEILNDTKNNICRITSISSKKIIKVANDGISGSSAKSWVSGNIVNKSVQANDTHIFVQLGTNDRHQSGRIDELYSNYTIIYETIKKISPSAHVIVMSANSVTQNEGDGSVYKFKMKDVNKAAYDFATNFNLSFISNYSATIEAKMYKEQYLADSLHPNDYGYKLIFENIKNRIID